MKPVINLKKTRVTFAAALFMTVLLHAGDMEGVHAASSERKVHTPILEEVSELTEEELLRLQQETSEPKPDSGRFTRGILWKIKKDEELIGYVFGTIHMNDKRIRKVREDVVGILDAMDSFAMESFPSDHYWNPYHGGQMIKGDMILPRGETLEQLIGAELYAKVEEALLKVGLDKKTIIRLKPWAAMRSFAVRSDNDEDLILDYELLDRAAAQRKELYQVESIEEFLATFYAMPQDVQIRLLEFTVNEYGEMRNTINMMLDAYLQEDLLKMHQISTRFIPDEPENEYYRQTYLKHIVKDRNVVMEHYMRKPMREKNTFIAVGALHLYGDQGVLALIEKDGYQVTRVPLDKI